MRNNNHAQDNSGDAVMDEITLKFWAKGDRERVYVNNDDNQSLGYFERITDAEERMPNSYYDRHRLAKGDLYEYSESYRFVGSNDIRERIITSLQITEIDGDDWHNFTEVSKKAKGGFPCWYGNTPDDEAKRLQVERDAAVYVLGAR